MQSITRWWKEGYDGPDGASVSRTCASVALVIGPLIKLDLISVSRPGVLAGPAKSAVEGESYRFGLQGKSGKPPHLIFYNPHSGVITPT